MGILLMALSIIAIIFAIISFSMDTGSYSNFKSYGGDAYTGIQNAAARTANNVQDLAGIVKTIGGLGFLMTGFILFVVGLGNCGLLDKLLSLIKPKKAVDAPVVDTAPTTIIPADPQPIGFDPQTGASIFGDKVVITSETVDDLANNQ